MMNARMEYKDGIAPAMYYRRIQEGRWDAIWGILGMLAGAAIHAEAFPLLKTTVLTWGDLGKITLPQVLGINHWFVIVPFLACSLLFFAWLEKKGL